MSQARDEAGNIWETDAQGNPVRLISAAGQSPQAPAYVPPVPARAAQVQAEQARQEAGSYRDQTRTDIAARGEQRDIGYKQYENTLKLRTDYDAMPEVKNYRTALPLFVQGLKTADTPQGSNALIYAYAKIMDPGSVVRESEAEGVANSDTLFGRAYAYAQKQLEGNGTFSPEARAGLIREMRTKTIELARSYDAQRNRFEADAKAFNIDPERVVGPHDAGPFVKELESFDQREGRGKYARSAAGGATGGSSGAQENPWPGVVGEDGKPLPPEGGYGRDPETGEWGIYSRTSDETKSPYDPGGPMWQAPGWQGVSGVNKGIAGTLGLPIDIPGAIDTGMTRGVNTLFGTDLKTQGEAYGGDTLGGSGWWQNRFRDAGFIGPEPTTPEGSWMNRAGQSVGSALVPVGGTGLSAGKMGLGMLTAAGGGAGAATAQQFFPGNPAADFAGEMLGGGLTGAGLANMARGRAQQAVNAQVPTIDQLKERARQTYQLAERRGIAADPTQTQQFAHDFRQTLRDEGQLGPGGRITDAPTSTNKALNLIEQYEGLPMRPTEMDTVRGVLAEGRKSPDASDQRLSGILTEQFDNWVRPMAPDFDTARDISMNYLQAEDIQQARQLAEAKAAQFSGSGLENALRTTFRGLDTNTVKGRQWFTPPVREAVENVSRGTPLANAARNLGRFAPTGPVSFATSMGAGGGLGFLAGGPAGAAVGASLGLAGMGGRTAATRMTNNAALQAEMIARNGGPISQVPLMSPDTERLALALTLAQLSQNREPNAAQQQQVGSNPDPLAGAEYIPPRRRPGIFGAPAR